jgi:hypothetical protein
MKQSRLKIKHLVEVDVNRTKIIEKKNSIESILYNRKDWLESDSSKNFFNESEYEITKLYLENKTNWYDEDGYIADLPTLENELRNLSNYFYIFDKRQKIYIDRNEALIKFYTEYNNTHNQAIKLIERDPWRFEHYNTTFRKDVSSVLEWLNTSLIEQDSKKLYDWCNAIGKTINKNSNYTGIKEINDLSGEYNAVMATTKLSNQKIINSQNAEVNGYYIYRNTEPRSGSGTSKFALGND